MGTSNPLPQLFGHSPFKPLQEHMATVTRCAEQVAGLMEALIAEDRERIESIRDTIFALESQADTVKNQIRSHLPKSLFLPVDRRDLLELLDLQDSIADTAEDIAELLIKRPVAMPEGMAEPLNEMVGRCVEACQQANALIQSMDLLMGFGFNGRESDRILGMASKLDKLEKETDRMGFDLAIFLFSQEDNLKPVSLMCWYQMIQWVGNLADYAEKIANRMRLFVAR